MRDDVCLRIEERFDRSVAKASRLGAVEVRSRQFADAVPDSDTLVGEVERGRLEDGAGEQRSGRGSHQQSLDQLSARTLTDESDPSWISPKGSYIVFDVFCGAMRRVSVDVRDDGKLDKADLEP